MEEEEERRLGLTPCSVFKMVAFVCSESVIPAIPNGKGDRVSLLHSLQPSDVLRCIWRRGSNSFQRNDDPLICIEEEKFCGDKIRLGVF